MNDNLKIEHCWICDEFTGNAGQGEDSLYDDEGGGAYCSGCWDTHQKEEGEKDILDQQEGLSRGDG